jgi:hypothetical protein
LQQDPFGVLLVQTIERRAVVEDGKRTIVCFTAGSVTIT